MPFERRLLFQALLEVRPDRLLLAPPQGLVALVGDESNTSSIDRSMRISPSMLAIRLLSLLASDSIVRREAFDTPGVR